jgi:hypothetical protein
MTQRRLAIFVEGQTETIFIKKLLLEVAGSKNIEFQEVSRSGIVKLASANPVDTKKYFVLIVDCQSDHAVKSAICERGDTLKRAKYDLVLGLRDIYPIPKSDIPKLEHGLRTGLPANGLNVKICLAKMEVEAWFIQEWKHYQQIDGDLSIDLIVRETGFDPLSDNAEELDHPAELLKQIYKLAGKSYTKTKKQVERTVNALDYAEIYTLHSERLSYLKVFLVHIDNFLS